MSRSKKDIRVINEVKRALDAALADGTISEDAHARLNTPGLKTRNKISAWDECGPPPPEPEPEPEVVVPEPNQCDMIESPKRASQKGIAWTKVDFSTVKRGHETRVVEMLPRTPMRAQIAYLSIFGGRSWHISTLGICKACSITLFPKPSNRTVKRSDETGILLRANWIVYTALIRERFIHHRRNLVQTEHFGL